MTERTEHAAPSTRSQEEIVERMDARGEGDPLGFETSEYFEYLDFDHARPYLKETVTAKEFAAATATAPPKEAMVSYMEFAFDKAHGERGISAERSIGHMVAWAWLSGDDKLLDYIENARYDGYGLSILRGICQRLEIDPKQHGDS